MSSALPAPAPPAAPAPAGPAGPGPSSGPGGKYVLDLTVSLGGALPDRSFGRVTARGDAVADISRDAAAAAGAPALGGAVFLWAATQEAASAELAVDAVRVLYDAEEPPEGFRRVARDLSGGFGPRRSFLAFRVAQLAPDSRPIANIALVAPGEEPGESLADCPRGRAATTPQSPAHRARVRARASGVHARECGLAPLYAGSHPLINHSCWRSQHFFGAD